MQLSLVGTQPQKSCRWARKTYFDHGWVSDCIHCLSSKVVESQPSNECSQSVYFENRYRSVGQVIRQTKALRRSSKAFPRNLCSNLKWFIEPANSTVMPRSGPRQLIRCSTFCVSRIEPAQSPLYSHLSAEYTSAKRIRQGSKCICGTKHTFLNLGAEIGRAHV